VFQLARTRREVFIVMEHVFGVTLLQIVERAKELGEEVPLDVIAFVVARTCYGLAYAHKKHDREGRHLGIVHRDICPTNILVTYRGIPKLSDFGVAKARTSSVDDEKSVAWGKYPYMAPEAVHRQGTDPRSDIYSLGLVLFEAITGHLAHDVESTRALKTALEAEKPHDLDPRRHRPYVPEQLANIIRRATALDPKDRHQDAMELAEGLGAVAAHVLPIPRRKPRFRLSRRTVPHRGETPLLVIGGRSPAATRLRRRDPRFEMVAVDARKTGANKDAIVLVGAVVDDGGSLEACQERAVARRHIESHHVFEFRRGVANAGLQRGEAVSGERAYDEVFAERRPKSGEARGVGHAVRLVQENEFGIEARTDLA
jgi:serine/threonine protein kinase